MQNKSAPSSFEIELSQMLRSESSIQSVAKKITSNWDSKKRSYRDLEVFSFFLMQSGMNLTLANFLSSLALKNIKIPWGHFLESLYLATPVISENLKKALIFGAKEQGLFSELARSHMLDHFDETIENTRNERFEKLKTKKKDHYEEMLGELKMSQSQGLDAEAEKLIAKLKKAYPDDPKIIQLKKSSDDNKALQLLENKQAPSTRKKRAPIDLYKKRDPVDIEILKQINLAMNEAANSNNALRKDFAIANIMWENFSDAVTHLEQQSLTISEFWLRLEALMKNRHFLTALEELNTLSTQVPNEPESTFALLYMKAQCLWEIGQQQEAIQIMEDIVRVRPQYRSSALFLNQWKDETR